METVDEKAYGDADSTKPFLSDTLDPWEHVGWHKRREHGSSRRPDRRCHAKLVGVAQMRLGAVSVEGSA